MPIVVRMVSLLLDTGCKVKKKYCYDAGYIYISKKCQLILTFWKQRETMQGPPTQFNGIPRKTPTYASVHLLFTICVPKSKKSAFQYFVLSLALVQITG